MKKKNKKNVKKVSKVKGIVTKVILVLYTISNVILIVNLIGLNGIENLFRYLLIVLFVFINVMLWYFDFKKKKSNIVIIISILLMVINIFVNYNFNKIYDTLDNVTKRYEEYTLTLVTLSDNDITSISEIDDDIGVITSKKNISNGYDFAREIIEGNDIKYDLVEYEEYLDIISDLYAGKIKYAFLPDNYVLMFSSQEEYKDIEKRLKVIHTDKKKEEIEVISKDVNKPFSILLMGVDTLESSYNADTLLLVTFNPETLSATMLSIPRDTYTKIACTGGKHKINSSGWYSDSCVINTVSDLMDIDIDYYAKINFTGIVDLVEALGGIDVDVVYPFCEQNSKREFGSNMIYIEEGLQHLNGEQALALTRNRHGWSECPSKYNEKGYYSTNLRNDITRGLNQQLVLKAILNRLKEIKELNTVYKLLDTVGSNVMTNMDRNTMLSFYDIFKNIIISSNGNDIDSIINIQKLSLEVYGTYINISGLDLSMIIAHQNSIDVVSAAMKENLNLKEKEVIKSFSFDVNTPYEEKVIGKNVYGGTTLSLFENFVGKDYTDVLSYCNKFGYNCNFEYLDITDGSYLNNQIIDQSIPANYDVSLIGNKEIIFKVAKVEENAKFNYSNCALKEYKDNKSCLVPSFGTLEEFNAWYKNFTYLKVSLIEVSDEDLEDEEVTNQSVVDSSVYELLNGNEVLEITYVKNSDEVEKDNDEEKEP